LTVDTTGWIEAEVSQTSRAWTREGDTLWLHYFPIPPDLPKVVGDDSVLVDQFQREVSSLPGGLVEAKWTEGQGLLPVAWIITK
jgi:hypothetical protein